MQITHDSERLAELHGWPPAAWLWWVQSGEAPPAGYLVRLYLVYVAREVLGVRVVEPVHADGVVAVVDGDVDRFAGGHFCAGAGSTAACEQIDAQVVGVVELVLGVEVHRLHPLRQLRYR